MKTLFKKLKHLLFLAALLNASLAASADMFCRFQAGEGGRYGRVDGNQVHVLTAAPWAGGKETGEVVRLGNVKLLSPSEPRSIIGLAGAYVSPDSNPPKTSRWFAKSASGAATDGDDIEIPSSLDALKVEVELVIVIGARVKDATPPQAKKAIFGYATGTEIFGFVESYHRVNGEEEGREESLLAPALKLGDNYAPFGPFIYTDIDWRDRERKLTITTASGETRVTFEHNTSGLLYPPEKIVSDLSRVQTLEPGDVIFSGTTQAFIAEAGETVTTEIEGLGVLRNKIVQSPR